MTKTKKLTLLAGPCVIEDQDMLNTTAGTLADICSQLDIDLTFKASFDKANRSSIDSYRGPGMEQGLEMLAKVRDKCGVRLISDVHFPSQVAPAAEVLDIIQLPAFLSRQTDFFIEAGKCGIPLNVKKGQFMSPQEISNIIKKYRDSGGKDIMITERGTFFGYGNLVVDFRSIPVIQEMGVDYIFDVTHSIQLPAARGGSSGGQREYIPRLTRAQIAAGADGLFMEVHPDPDCAKCDRESQMKLSDMKDFLVDIKELFDFINN